MVVERSDGLVLYFFLALEAPGTPVNKRNQRMNQRVALLEVLKREGQGTTKF